MTDAATNTPSGDTFIRERRRGFKQGQSDLLTRAGVKDDAELLSLVEVARKAKTAPVDKVEQTEDRPAPGKKKPEGTAGAPEQKTGETNKAFEERLAKFEETQAKIWARFEAEDKAKAEALKAQEAAAKEEAEAKAAKEQYDAEVEWFVEQADKVGALVADKRKKSRLLAIWTAEIQDLPKREFEKYFGDKADPAAQEKKAAEILAEIAKDHPSLFKAAEDKTKDGSAAAGTPAKPATTGTPATPPEGAKPATGTREPLDVRKLSREQYREYNSNPKAFRDRFSKGLVEYQKK